MIKILNKACQVLAAVAGITTLVFFFFTFGKFAMADGTVVTGSGFQVALGTELAEGIEIAKSSKILFNIIMTILAVATAIFTFFSKSKVLKYVSAAFSATVAIFMLVVALGVPYDFIDTRFVDDSLKATVTYSVFVLLTSIAMFVATFAQIGHFLLDDYIEVCQSKGAKKPLLKRIWRFFKDYKSETKKIVWPGIKEVLKNTGIVLVMFVVIGIIIWVVDLGLGELLKLIW